MIRTASSWLKDLERRDTNLDKITVETNQDLQSIALWMANDQIQSGDFSALSSTIDNPIIQESSSYKYSI